MKLCRFKTAEVAVRIGRLQEDETVADLTAAGFESLTALLEDAEALAQAEAAEAPSVPLTEVSLLTPVERQEVWAAGVTYLRSKKARMEESDFSANAYDQVYDAPRPEIFFKSLPEKVAHPGDAVGIRADATWNVPEPELT